MRRGADLSECGRYRHRLSRIWDEDTPALVFVMLNPSTADSVEDDQTIRRCMHFARRDGWGGIIVVNLFELRATSPKRLRWPGVDPIGPDKRRRWLESEVAAGARNGAVVVAWGADRMAQSVEGRRAVARVARIAGDALRCLGTTNSGAPRHPCRLANDTPLIPWHPDGTLELFGGSS